MIPRRELDRYARTNRTLAEMAVERIRAYFPLVDFADPGTKTALVAMVIAAINVFGAAAAQNAAMFFTEQTGKQSIDAGGIVESIVTGKEFRHAIAATVGFAVAMAVQGAIERGSKAVTDKVEVAMKEIPAQVMEENAREHRVKYARVPMGETTCEFCTLMASRGFVYASRESAGEFNKWHSLCDCEIVASNEGVEGYDPERYYDEYKQAEEIISPEAFQRWHRLSKSEREYFGSFNEFKTKSILAQMRAIRSGTWDGQPVVPQSKFASNTVSTGIPERSSSNQTAR